MKFEYEYTHLIPEDYVDIFSQPDWYILLQDELNKYFFEAESSNKLENNPQLREERIEFVKITAELLNANRIYIGEEGRDWDIERKEIDTIIIHHTSTPHDTPLVGIDALVMLRLYAKSFCNEEGSEYGKPIWSNHFHNEKMTFIPYHYLITREGEIINTLKDEYIGWHAGNWDINCRSIAISFVDQLKDAEPSKEAIQAANQVIAKYPNCKVMGHREVNPKTTCPGNTFLGDGGWKEQLSQ